MNPTALPPSSRRSPALHSMAASGEQPGKGNWRSIRILIADDEPDTVNTLTAILEDEGHRVKPVFQPDDVIPTIRDFQPDAIILDIVMPRRSGLQLARQIRQEFFYRPLLIAITGVYVKPDDTVLTTVAGFDHHITKPANPDEVLSLLEPVIQKRR